MSSHVTRQISREGDGELKGLKRQSSVAADSDMDDRPSFCFNEEQREMKTFHERKTDVDAAIEWIVKDIVSHASLSLKCQTQRESCYMY